MAPESPVANAPMNLHKGGRRRISSTRAHRVWMGVAFALALLTVAPSQLTAHGVLRRAVPGNGDHLTAVPRELRLTFTEPVEVAVARLELSGPNGPVALAPLALDPDSSTVLVGPIRGGLVAGAYTVRWQVTGTDGHPVRGSYSFTVLSSAAGLASSTAIPSAAEGAAPQREHHDPVSLPAGPGFDAESPLYAAVRWLTFLGLLGVIGAVAFRWVVLPLAQRQGTPETQMLQETASRRAAGLGLGFAVLLAGAALLRLYAQSYALHGSTSALNPGLVGTLLLQTTWGWGWLLQAAGTTLSLVGFALVWRTETGTYGREPERVHLAAGLGSETEQTQVQGSPPLAEDRAGIPVPGEPSAIHTLGWAVAALGAVALAFAPGLSGHAASVPQLTTLAILADGAHVLGAGGWLGSLLIVVAVGIPAALRLPKGTRGSAVASLVNAFSPTALVFASVVVATGVFAAWLHLGSVPALWESAYGRTLLLKLAILSVVFGTGAYNWLKVRPTLGDEIAAGRLRRSATLELAVGTVVLGVTAFLVAMGPPSGMGSMAQAEATAHSESGP